MVREIGWLIEGPMMANGLTYLSAWDEDAPEIVRQNNSGSLFCITTDPLKAIRFSRQEDAERMNRCLSGLNIFEGKVSEHVWLSAGKRRKSTRHC